MQLLQPPIQNPKNRARALCRALLAAVMVFAAAPVHPQDPKVGFVSLGRLERESVQGQKAIGLLKQEFAQREQEILDLQNRIKKERARFESEKGTLSPSAAAEKWKPIGEMMKQSDRMVYAMQEDVRLRRRQVMADFLRELSAAIETVSKAQSFDLVLQEAVFSSKRVDITDQVLAEMAKRAGTGGR